MDTVLVKMMRQSLTRFSTRFYSIAFLLLLISSWAFADGDPIYCFNTTITLKNKSVLTGYFRSYVYTMSDEGGFYYFDGSTKMRLKVVRKKNKLIISETEYHFFNEIKRKASDSLEIYTDTAILWNHREEDEEFNIPFFIGKSMKISRDMIDQITVHYMYRLQDGAYGITAISTDDKKWISDNPLLYKYVGGSELCSYDAISFNISKENTLKNLETIKKLFKTYELEEKQQNEVKIHSTWNFILKEVERLRLLKILITVSCSC